MQPDSPEDALTEETLSQQLRAALDAAATDEPCQGPDWVLLAEYLDHRLDETTRQDLEAHLSVCASCRRLVMESAGSTQRSSQLSSQLPGTLAPGNFAPAASPMRRRWPLALAAGLAALAAGLLWEPAGQAPPDLEAVAPPLAASGSTTMEEITKGLLPPIEAFEGLLDLGRRPVLRHGSSQQAPQPLSPRWTLTTESRPTFLWLASAAASAGPPAEPAADTPNAPGTSEILLVDTDESVVARFPVIPRAGGISVAEWPDSLPGLEIGKVYAWKINTFGDHGHLASDYVPFQVAGLPQGSTSPEQRLTSQPLKPAARLSEATRLANAGHLEAALKALGGLQTPDEQAAAEPLLQAIFEAQKSSPELALQQRRRLGWPAVPTADGTPRP